MHVVKVDATPWKDVNDPIFWLREKFGPRYYYDEFGSKQTEVRWARRYLQGSLWEFHFKNERDAVLFALRWA